MLAAVWSRVDKADLKDLEDLKRAVMAQISKSTPDTTAGKLLHIMANPHTSARACELLEQLSTKTVPEEQASYLYVDDLSALLRDQYTRFKITPLQLAILMGSTAVALKCIELMDAPGLERQDVRGWTALHMATVLEQTQIVDALRKQGIKEDIRNDRGGTAEDLELMLHPDLISQPPGLFFQAGKGAVIEPMTRAMFKEKTGAEFTRALIVPSKYFLEDWLNPVAIKSSEEDIFGMLEMPDETYIRTYSHPAEVILVPVTHTDRGEPMLGMGYGLVAKNNIKAGTLIQEYTGEWIGSEPGGDENAYTLDGIDGYRFRSLAACINDDVPNTCFLPREGRGFYRRSYVLSTRDISAGEPLGIDYHQHSIKHIAHRIISPERLFDRFYGILNKHDFNSQYAYFVTVVSLLAKDKSNLKLADLLFQFLYLINTQTAAIQLVFEEVVSAKFLEKMFESVGYLVNPDLQISIGALNKGLQTWEQLPDPLFKKLFKEKVCELIASSKLPIAITLLHNTEGAHHNYMRKLKDTASSFPSFSIEDLAPIVLQHTLDRMLREISDNLGTAHPNYSEAQLARHFRL